MNTSEDVIWNLILWWLAALVGVVMIWFAVIILDFRTRKPNPRDAHLFLCPMCSRLTNRDWITPRGYCCDCDEEITALDALKPVEGPHNLTTLNPNLVSRPSPRYYVW